MSLKIRNIVDIQIGYQFRRKVEHYPGGTHRVVQIKDFDDDNRLNTSALFRVIPERNVDRYLVNKGHVLFLSRGRRNFAFAIISDLEMTIAAGYFFILRKKSDRILPEYLAWFINQKPAQSYIQKYSRGTVINYINRQNLENLEVAVPDLETQKKITALYNLNVRENDIITQIQDLKNVVTNQLLINKVFESNKEDSNEGKQ